MNFKPFIMEFTKIKAPKFRVGRYVLNEYELRTLMLEVAAGKQQGNIKVKCSSGDVALITEKGALSNPLAGLKLAGQLSMDLMALLYKREG